MIDFCLHLIGGERSCRNAPKFVVNGIAPACSVHLGAIADRFIESNGPATVTLCA